jgi:hypothetical protein
MSAKINYLLIEPPTWIKVIFYMVYLSFKAVPVQHYLLKNGGKIILNPG